MYSYLIEEKIEKIDTTPYVDVNGNRYEKAYRFWTTSVYSDETEILYDTYAINGKYEHFSAVVAPDSGMKNEDESKDTIIYIVGDGEVLFSTYINKNTSPVSIELDITGVSELKVGMRGGKRVRIVRKILVS